MNIPNVLELDQSWKRGGGGLGLGLRLQLWLGYQIFCGIIVFIEPSKVPLKMLTTIRTVEAVLVFGLNLVLETCDPNSMDKP